MPRSKLLDTLHRIAQDHRIADREQVSTQTVRGWREERAERDRREEPKGPSRRGFLFGGTAAAASLMMMRKARAANTPSIAIVGGGIAGLSCALQLADAGYASTVYESNTRLGGRMFSNTSGYWTDNQVSEWGGELIDTNHKTIRTLAKRFGLDVVDVRAAEPNGSEDTFYFSGAYYKKSQADSDFQVVHQALNRDTQAAGYPVTYNNNNPAAIELDNTSIYEWIERNVPGGHASPMGKLLDVAYNIEYGAETSAQSSLNLINLLGYNQQPGNFEMFGKSDERSHIAGGNGRLPLAIASQLGSAVQTGWSLIRIAKTSTGRFNLTFKVGSSTRTVAYDYVVLCLPFAVLRDLDYAAAGFDPLKDHAIQNLGMGRNGKLQLQFTSRYWNAAGPWGASSNGALYSDTGFQAGWDVTRAQAGASGILVDYTGGNTTLAMSTKSAFATIGASGVSTDANRFLTQLEPVLPGGRAKWNGKATSSLPHLDPNYKCSYSFWALGQTSAFGGYEGVRQGNCLFAGEHTSLDFQGFMEGGAATGQRAANEIIADLK